MAILKMKMVNVVGPVADFDRIATNFIADKDIHIENVFDVLENVKGLYQFPSENQYDDYKQKISKLIDLGGIDAEKVIVENQYDDFCATCAINGIEGIVDKYESIYGRIESLVNERETIQKRLDELTPIFEQLGPLLNFDVDLKRLYEFEFIKFRFGKMPLKSQQTLDVYLGDLEVFFIPTSSDMDYVWGVYFIPTSMVERVDGIFTSLLFQRIRITDDVHGTPKQSYDYLAEEQEQLVERLKAVDDSINNILNEEQYFIVYMHERINLLKRVNEVRINSGHTKESFYIVGWMAEDEIGNLQNSLESEDQVVCLVEEPETVSNALPPSKLKNNKLVKPFEMFVKMYGVPAYHEFDPTLLMAITYTLFFGAMFGDVGQGLVLAIGGFLLAKFKKSDLGAIIGIVGLSSIVFGFIYGSIFGNEEILPGLIKPMENISSLLLYAVIVGTVTIGLVMVINIIIGIKNKNIKKALFSQNGLAGFIFYWTVLAIVLKGMVSGGKTSGIVILLCVAIPLVLIMLQEPLTKLLEKRKDWKPKSTGLFFVEAIFELFEIVLSYVTNTISFVRLGAFAMIHAGMMGVVFILADMVGGSGSVVVIVLGNLLVMALEGLIVGIQTLRLEFYELFSRFYEGNGKEFRSLKDMDI